MRKASKEAVAAFLQNPNIKWVEKIMSALGKTHAFIEAVDSEEGQQIMNMLSYKMNDAFHKIANLEATDMDKMRYQVIKEITDEIMGVFKKHDSLVKEVENSIPQKGGKFNADRRA